MSTDVFGDNAPAPNSATTPLLVFSSWKLLFHEESLSSAERTQFAITQGRSSAKRYKNSRENAA